MSNSDIVNPTVMPRPEIQSLIKVDSSTMVDIYVDEQVTQLRNEVKKLSELNSKAMEVIAQARKGFESLIMGQVPAKKLADIETYKAAIKNMLSSVLDLKNVEVTHDLYPAHTRAGRNADPLDMSDDEISVVCLTISSNVDTFQQHSTFAVELTKTIKAKFQTFREKAKEAKAEIDANLKKITEINCLLNRQDELSRRARAKLGRYILSKSSEGKDLMESIGQDQQVQKLLT